MHYLSDDQFQRRTWAELLERNKFISLPYLVLCILSGYACSDMHEARPWTWVCYALVLLGSVLRIALYFPIKKDGPSLFRSSVYALALALIGTGWGLLFTSVNDFYPPNSLRILLYFLLICGICSGGAITLASRPANYFFVTIPMTLMPILLVFYQTGSLPSYSFFTLSLYNFIIAGQVCLSHKYIRRSLEHETELTRERDRLQSLVNAVPGFVSFIDHDLHYRAMNDLGNSFYKGQEVLGRSLTLLHPDSEFLKFVTDFISSDKSSATSEMKIDFLGKTSFFILSIRRSPGTMGGAVIVSIPIDELVASREIIRQQEAKALYTAKLASLGEMAAGIGHEINNPLGIILGYSDQIIRGLQRGDSPEKAKGHALKIQSTVDRIARIIKSLKSLSRNGENDVHRTFKLHSIIEPCLEVSRQRFITENVSLELINYDPDIELVGQEIQLSQVIMNLINNAYDAILDGNERWIRIELEAEEDHLNILLQDSGQGIPAHIRHKIMQPFFTTKEVNKGTGLGLSISKTIVENHGGTLYLDDSRSHTTFVMRLKRSRVTAEAIA